VYSYFFFVFVGVVWWWIAFEFFCGPLVQGWVRRLGKMGDENTRTGARSMELANGLGWKVRCICCG
jgi:hypothetical protein